ncbi:MAG: thioredoxin domain-containing protein [Flavobacteriaceae bacterium]|nr:thioredoxin domain-containing protein [Flavobacteriaceae bacterium]MDH3795685.1 thioredoxin domain-containing protein [Flavobacteriaceae bacterium]
MHTNDLIHESSPYLLQHAHNPVNWVAWKEDALARAKKEEKLILISIGYAACHWCHVMEKECFEDAQVAAVMNAQFVNIKVDREERPDVDQIYMDALQLMTGSGGWPLNIIALPDGRPFWGATYVPKDRWQHTLAQLAQLYEDDPAKVIQYAEDLTQGLISINQPSGQGLKMPEKETLDLAIMNWLQKMDPEYGGYNRAPKFMMPVNLEFLMNYYAVSQKQEVLDYLNTTLTRMAYGGLQDQLAGGFARYSVDMRWHVPHFEKMLYDNAQLLSVYSKGYAITGNTYYKQVVDDTISFLTEELMHPEGGFYASLDADSLDAHGELEEGAFYVWTKEELQEILMDDFPRFAAYYNVNDFGFWEADKYVLIRTSSDTEFARKWQMTEEELQAMVQSWKETLLPIRKKRSAPRLDSKILVSWNALVIKGLADAARYLEESKWTDLAVETASYIESNHRSTEGRLYRTPYNADGTIHGFADDYALLADAYIALYETCSDLQWLERSKGLFEALLSHFYDPKSGLFHYTSSDDAKLIRRSFEREDNVIPASNSVLAQIAFKLDRYYPHAKFGEVYAKIRTHIPEAGKSMGAYANWMQLYLWELYPYHEVVITGKDYKHQSALIRRTYLPQSILAAGNSEVDLDLFKGRLEDEKTLFYICEHGSCQLPLEDSQEALLKLIGA